MNSLTRLCLSLGIIFASLTLGYCFRLYAEKKFSKETETKLSAWRKGAQTLAVFILLPLAAMLSLWGFPKPDTKLFILPFIGLGAYVFGGGLALLAAWLLQLKRAQAGSLYCCASFANVGAIGALVCLLFLGEDAIALAALYRLFEEIFYFGAAFPVARRFGRHTGDTQGYFKPGPAIILIILGLGAGICLNMGGVYRPEILGAVASASLIIATIIFLLAIGLTLRLSRIGRYWKEIGALCVIKFILLPFLLTGMAFLIGLGAWEGGIELKAVAILSAMPVAMTSLIPPAIFNLDVDLANACWIISTLALIIVLPALALVLPQL